VRAFGATLEAYEDRYATLAFAWAGRVTIAVVHQTTDDPNEATDAATGERFRRAYDALEANIDLGGRHQVHVFWGQRRGGLACTAGTCYKVRGFEGVSARLVSRF